VTAIVLSGGFLWLNPVENVLVNSVKGSREIEKYESGNFLLIAGKENVIGGAE
jgi:hypothetical protein